MTPMVLADWKAEPKVGGTFEWIDLFLALSLLPRPTLANILPRHEIQAQRNAAPPMLPPN